MTFENTLEDGKGVRLANKFLRALFAQTMNNSLVFRKKEEYFPFVHKERQMHSVISPAMFKLTSSSLMEFPIIRTKFQKFGNKRSAKKSAGWIDYACKYGKPGVGFFIEFKHDWNNISNEHVRQAILNKWDSAKSQIRSVKGEVAGWGSDKGAIRIAIVFVVHYTTKSEAISKDGLHLQHKNIINKMTPKPNWSGLLKIDKKWTGLYEYEKSKEYHPGVSWFAYVTKIQN